MLSVIIPTYKEPYLNRTIRSLLWNKRADIEIIVVLDGASQDVYKHHRVHVIELPEQRGLRNAINVGVRVARGQFIMKVDAHCKFGKGFDIQLRPNKNEVMIPRRYDLDLDKWQEQGAPIDFQKLIIHPTYKKFQGISTKRKTDASVIETLAFQGSCWVMHKDWLPSIFPLDEETYGRFEHEPVEISFKTWRNGGKLLVNTNTWYAHPTAAKRTHRTPYDTKVWAAARELHADDYKKYVLNHELY